VPVAGLLSVIAEGSVSDAEIDAFVADFQANFVPEDAEAEFAGPTADTVEIEGHTVRYLKRGDGGEAAILIHGFGGDLDNWLFNHETLAASRSVYALDLPGHGGSSKQISAGTAGDFAKVLVRFLEAVGLPRAHLVGHSFGGAIALEVALAQPDRVASVGLIASAALGPEIDGDYIEGFITAAQRRRIKPHLEKLFADPALVSRQLVDAILKYKRLDGVDAALRTVADAFCPGGKQSVVLRDRLGELSMPVLVLWGEKDRILPASHAQGLPDSIQTRIIPGSGHMVQMEAASEVNDAVGALWGGRE